MNRSAVYMYVCDDEVVYVGKSDGNLGERIRAHKKEDKFKPYLERSEIVYFETTNNAYCHIYETYLINLYHPVLNIVLNLSDEMTLRIPCPTWRCYQNGEAYKNRKVLSIQYQKGYDPRSERIEKLEDLVEYWKNTAERRAEAYDRRAKLYDELLELYCNSCKEKRELQKDNISMFKRLLKAETKLSKYLAAYRRLYEEKFGKQY